MEDKQTKELFEILNSVMENIPAEFKETLIYNLLNENEKFLKQIDGKTDVNNFIFTLYSFILDILKLYAETIDELKQEISELKKKTF